MISKNIKDYVKVYKDFIDPVTCAKAVKNLNASNWQTHVFYLSSENKNVSFENELSVSYDEITEKNEINQKVWEALHQYILKDFSDFNSWFDGWTGYTYVRFNKYDPQTKMKLHCDHIHSMFDGQRKGIPILTVLGALNSDYTGGEFVMWEDEVIDLPAGAIAVFPSNFMYPHEVRPVKTGVRYSFVSWAW